MTALRLLSASLAVLAASLACTAVASATFPGRNGKIAFVVGQENSFMGDLGVMNADGTGRDTLYHAPAGNFGRTAAEPSWSPDGRMLAFQMVPPSNLEPWSIYTIRSDGGGARQITFGEPGFPSMGPAWGTGGRIAYARDGYCCSEGPPELWLMRSDGSRQSQLTRNGADLEGGADWSPNGSRIAFSLQPYLGNWEVGPGDLYTQRLSGGAGTPLTDTPAVDERSPSWSPDGRRIAFASDREGDYDIYVMNADGTGVRRLTGSVTGGDDAPAWSPDGRRIAFESYRGSADPGACSMSDWNAEACDSDIYVMNADGSGPSNLTDTPAVDEFLPAWQATR